MNAKLNWVTLQGYLRYVLCLLLSLSCMGGHYGICVNVKLNFEILQE